jgi:serine/threonine-protein kinase
MALSIGSLLAGRYEITAPIATGGMGEVWRARDRVLDREVAAKVLKSEYTTDPSFLARFRNEARHTAALSHPNIASVYDYGETTDDSGTQKLAFLVMEYVDGQPLVTILHEEGRLPVDWTLHVLGQAADGLSAAHRAGVVHRDIKPGNLMVRPDGVVKLTDFGIAQARDSAPLTRTGMVVGTAQYLSPEQAQGMECTAASDVYSLGVVAFECLAGARPFDGASQVAIALAHINRPPPPLPADVPPAVRLLVERALAKDSADRFTDGGAFAEAVRRVAAGGSLAVAPSLAPVPVNAPATAPTQAVDPDGATRVFAAPATGAAAGAAAGGGTPPTGPVRPMPPLQGPPADDGLPGDGEPDDRSAHRRRLWIAAAVLLVLLLAGGTYLLLSSGGRDPSAGENTATATTTGATAGSIALVADDIIGRPFDDVAAELEAQDLTVRRAEANEDQLDDAGQPLDAGDVAAFAPAGPVSPGDEVTLYVADQAWPPADEEEPTTTAPQTTTTPPTTTSAPPTTEETTDPTTDPTTNSSTAGGSTAPPPPPPPGGGGDPPPDGEGQGAPLVGGDG